MHHWHQPPRPLLPSTLPGRTTLRKATRKTNSHTGRESPSERMYLHRERSRKGWIVSFPSFFLFWRFDIHNSNPVPFLKTLHIRSSTFSSPIHNHPPLTTPPHPHHLHLLLIFRDNPISLNRTFLNNSNSNKTFRCTNTTRINSSV